MDRFRCTLVLRGRGVTIPSALEWHGAQLPLIQGVPEPVADGVYVIADHRVPIVPNVGIVVGQRAALVIDTGLGQSNGGYVLEQARSVAGGRPMYVATTHVDPGHGFGMQAFNGNARILFSQAQRDELERHGPAYVETFRRLDPALGVLLDGVELSSVQPDLVFSDGDFELDLGGHRAVLRQYGPAHAGDDQVVVVDDRVVFAGDLVLTRMFPIVPYFPPFDANIDGNRWIAALDQLIASRPEIVVPGHGEIGDAALIRGVREYLAFVREEAGRLRANGSTADDAVAKVAATARTRWSSWENPEWIPFAARAFYAESAPLVATQPA
jgi:glyoxylase-like metal-dependent hydrolase (beta-lactamase superfamily II)